MSFTYSEVSSPSGSTFTFDASYSDASEIAVMGYDGKYWSELAVSSVDGQSVTLAESADGLHSIRISNNAADIKKLNTTIKKKKKLIDDHKCKYNLKCKECLYNKKQNGLQYNEEEYDELLIEKEKLNNELEKLGKNMKNCNDIIDKYNNFLESFV